jgi:hypothetical protein
LPKIQFCEGAARLANLAGEAARSSIGLDGKVHEATATGVSVAVASCVADVIRAIEFPRSKDGVTQVHYPFTVRSTAGN